MAREEDISVERPEETMLYRKEGRDLREQLSEQLRQRPEYEEYLRLLADKDLWSLMLIPFSPELAKLAEQVVKPTLNVAVSDAVSVSEAVEAELKPTKDMVIINEAIARTLGIAPSEIIKINYENLTYLDLSYSSIVDLKPLANLKNLQQLHLAYCKNVKDISPLKDLTNLQRLYLNDTQVSDLEPLKDLTNLQRLYLSGTQVSNFEPLKVLKNLQQLDLSRTQVSNVEPLKDLQNLEWLYLYSTQVSDLEPLKALTNLQRLYLDKTQVKDLEPLKALINLQRLYLSGTQVSDLEPLKALTKLQKLDLSGTQVKDLEPLKALTNLQELDLTDTQVSKEQRSMLKLALPNLVIIR